jgi:hypothetical protein
MQAKTSRQLRAARMSTPVLRAPMGRGIIIIIGAKGKLP